MSTNQQAQGVRGSSCSSCGNCAGKCHSKPKEEKAESVEPVGIIARRPWIWIVLGYIAFLGVMFTFVWIAQTHADPRIPLSHQTNRPGVQSRTAEGTGAAQTPRSPVSAPVSSAVNQEAQ